MNNIRQSLEPTILDFMKGLDSIEHKVIEKTTEVDKLIQSNKDENLYLKQQGVQNNKTHEAMAEKLSTEINKSKELQTELQIEIDKNKSIQKNFDDDRRDIQNKLKNTEAERKLAEDNRRRLDVDIKKYKDKTEALMADTTSIENRLKLLRDEEAKDRARKSTLLKQEEKNIKDGQEISIREVNLKIKTQQVELEIKRSGVNV